MRQRVRLRHLETKLTHCQNKKKSLSKHEATADCFVLVEFFASITERGVQHVRARRKKPPLTCTNSSVLRFVSTGRDGDGDHGKEHDSRKLGVSLLHRQRAAVHGPSETLGRNRREHGARDRPPQADRVEHPAGEVAQVDDALDEEAQASDGVEPGFAEKFGGHRRGHPPITESTRHS